MKRSRSIKVLSNPVQLEQQFLPLISDLQWKLEDLIWSQVIDNWANFKVK